jgi:hypothetical protein
MEFSKQASHHVSSNKQWSDQETAGVMQDAAKSYNKIKQIHDAYGIDEQLIAQMSLDVSGGIDVGRGVIGQAIGISGGMVLRDDQTILANVNKAVAEITDLGQSKEFKSAISHAQNWSKSSNQDIGDQNLAQSLKNFSQHYESSLQSQKSAAAALDRSTAISNQIDFVRANAQRIDTVENQRFAEWAADQLGGYDKLEEVARKDINRLQGMASHYLESNFGGNHHLPANEADLAKQYKVNSGHIEQSNVIKPDFSRVEKMAADNYVSQERVIDDTAAKGWMQNIDQTKNDFFNIRNKRERAWAERNARMIGEELQHREENLGYIQRGKSSQMRENFVKNN